MHLGLGSLQHIGYYAPQSSCCTCSFTPSEVKLSHKPPLITTRPFHLLPQHHHLYQGTTTRTRAQLQKTFLCLCKTMSACNPNASLPLALLDNTCCKVFQCRNRSNPAPAKAMPRWTPWINSWPSSCASFSRWREQAGWLLQALASVTAVSRRQAGENTMPLGNWMTSEWAHDWLSHVERCYQSQELVSFAAFTQTSQTHTLEKRSGKPGTAKVVFKTFRAIL